MTDQNMSSSSFVDDVGYPFLARRVAQFHDLLAEQGQALLTERGVTLDSRLGSCLYLIGERDGLSVAELAEELDLSHQLATYRVKKLREAGLAEQSRDERDRTRYVLKLTPAGRDVRKALSAQLDDFARVYEALFNELGVNLFEVVSRARKALLARSISDRAEALR